MNSVRTANRAVILDGDRLLVTVNHNQGVEFFLLPGGGQEFGEDRIASVRRECREEIGCEVEVQGLACLRSYVGGNHRLAETDADFHQEEALWWCSLLHDAEPALGSAVDDCQSGVAWKPIAELEASGEFSPMPLLEWLRLPSGDRPLYLGDVL